MQDKAQAAGNTFRIAKGCNVVLRKEQVDLHESDAAEYQALKK
jgi:hypothetical protein